MQPFIAGRRAHCKSEVVSLKEKLKVQKKPMPSRRLLKNSKPKSKDQEKLAREAQAKADAIGATVFDLKAVNPNTVVKLDTRTPVEVIESIEAQGQIVSKSLKTLRTLLKP